MKVAGRPPRRLALLGGTTTSNDLRAAAHALASWDDIVEGDAIRRYERAFAERHGLEWSYAFAAGRVALYGILGALEIGPGDEVLLQAPTNVVVANAIRYRGAKPVFVDCELDSYNIDLDDARSRITPRTKALLLQHTFGIPVDLDRAVGLAEEHGLAVIEDCVHALGSEWKGRPVGTFGQAAFFSTEETKTISTTMGGVAVTRDPELARRIERFQASCEPPPRGLVARWVLKLVVYHALTEPHVHRFARAAYEALGNRNPLPVPVSAEEARGELPRGYERRLSNAQAQIGLTQLAGLS